MAAVRARAPDRVHEPVHGGCTGAPGRAVRACAPRRPRPGPSLSTVSDRTTRPAQQRPGAGAAGDLLGAMACGQLAAFSHLAADVVRAPAPGQGLELARLAAAELAGAELLLARLAELGLPAEEAMAPFAAAVAGFHARTAPADWAETLVKAYVGEGIAADFYREVSAGLDPATRELVLRASAGARRTAFVVPAVHAALEREPRLAGRLALWGRRLVGEALTQLQRVAADRDALVSLLGEEVLRPAAGPGGGLLVRLTEAHARRMESLGLAA